MGGGRRKAGEERLESEIPKVAGITRNFVIFCSRNGTKKGEPLRKGAGTRSNRYGKREVQNPPCSPSPLIVTWFLAYDLVIVCISNTQS